MMGWRARIGFLVPPGNPTVYPLHGAGSETGKSVVVAPERPPIPMPGTFWVTSAVWKAEGSVPPDVGSTAAVRGLERY